jgi:uncharacterized protein YeeX (DUF496 family)
MNKKQKIFRKEKDKNNTLIRNNKRLIKMLRNLSYILSSDEFYLKEIDIEKFKLFKKS